MVPSHALVLSALAGAAALSEARSITVKNSCNHTVWPALFTGSGSAPDAPTGWEAVAGYESTFEVPQNWTSGRIWGRTGCNFTDSSNTQASTCISGGCVGGLECTAWGNLPATLAEFGLDSWNGIDFFDISLVDGFNLPIAITPSIETCTALNCTTNLNNNCPSVLQTDFDDSGVNTGCSSSCNADKSDANCCTGSLNSATTCLASGVAYYSYFKSACANAYAYAFDESSGTALFACGNTTASPDYTVEFCPGNA